VISKSRDGVNLEFQNPGEISNLFLYSSNEDPWKGGEVSEAWDARDAGHVVLDC
jgi:hypothetical protein